MDAVTRRSDVDVATNRRLGLLRDAVAFLPTAGRLTLATLCGFAWGARLSALAFVPLLFAAWWRAHSRLEAAAVVMTYHAVAARSLIVAGSHFYDASIGFGVGVVVLGSFIAAIPWMLLWRRPESPMSFVHGSMRVLGVFVLSALPPLTAFAVPSVWASSGVWFPRSGVLGIVALIAVGAAMRAGLNDGTASRRAAALSLHVVICSIVGIRAELGALTEPLVDVAAVHTSFEASSSDTFDFLRQWDVAHAAMDLAAAHDAPVLVLPESVGGLWQPAMHREWARFAAELARKNRRALLGMIVPRPDGKLHAGVMLLGAEEGRYLQRVPMPLAMWRPWSRARDSFEPMWFGSGTMRVHRRDLGVFVCWEIGVLWTVLGSVAEGADALVVVANTAWARGTDAVQAEKQMTEAWGALFALPTIVAMNR